MRMHLKSVLILSMVTALLQSPLTSQAQKSSPDYIVVTVTDIDGKIGYKVNENQTENLLRALEDARKQFGRSYPVLVLADERVGIDILRSIGGTAEKADLGAPRYFSVTADKHYMSEIVFKRHVPFSTRPPFD